jgi:putative transcriptional regulator
MGEGDMDASYTAGIIGSISGNAGDSRKTTRRQFDAVLLTPVEALSGDDILALRVREGVSQSVLALHLNVRTKLISDWERGVKHPSGPSLKLLSLIRSKGIGAIA